MTKDALIKYYPPKNKFDYNDITTWQKVFIIDKNECAEQLDFDLKINALKKKYKLKPEYMDISFIDN